MGLTGAGLIWFKPVEVGFVSVVLSGVVALGGMEWGGVESASIVPVGVGVLGVKEAAVE